MLLNYKCWIKYIIDINVTYYGGQAMGKELKYVQMSRWSMHVGEGSEQQ